MAHMPINSAYNPADLFPDIIQALERRYNDEQGRPISHWVLEIWEKLGQYCVEQGEGPVFKAADTVITLMADDSIWNGKKSMNYIKMYDHIWNVLTENGQDPSLEFSSLSDRIKRPILRMKRSGWRHRTSTGIWMYLTPKEAWEHPMGFSPGGFYHHVLKQWQGGFLKSKQYKQWQAKYPKIDLSKPDKRPLFHHLNIDQKKGQAKENEPSLRKGPAAENTMTKSNKYVHHAITGRRMGVIRENNNGNSAPDQGGQGGKARYGEYGDDLFFDGYDGYYAYDASVDGYNPGLDQYHGSVHGDHGDFISDGHYHQYDSYNHYHSDYILLVAIGGFIFIAMCCSIIIISIIVGFVSGKFYEMKKNEKSLSNRHKYDVVHLNEDQV